MLGSRWGWGEKQFDASTMSFLPCLGPPHRRSLGCFIFAFWLDQEQQQEQCLTNALSLCV